MLLRALRRNEGKTNLEFTAGGAQTGARPEPVQIARHSMCSSSVRLDHGPLPVGVAAMQGETFGPGTNSQRSASGAEYQQLTCATVFGISAISSMQRR